MPDPRLAHVCVPQTALDLYQEGEVVLVVADGAGSRRASDRDRALMRMRQQGVGIASRDMVVFSWLGAAGTPLFKVVSTAFLK